MRSVNLLPPELRPRIPGEGDPRIAWGVLGGLAILLLMVVVAISYSNKATTLNDEAAQINAEAARHQAATQITPVRTDDVADQVASRTLLVGGLAAVRFPWNTSMKDLSKSIPPDVTLDTIDGVSASPAQTTSTGAPAEAAGPTLTLGGCASGWVGYARFMTWLRQMPGVKDVSSSTSALGSATDESKSGSDGKKVVDRNNNCGPAPLTFSLSVVYAPTTADLLGLPKPEAAPAAAGGATGATTTPAAGTPAASGTGG